MLYSIDYSIKEANLGVSKIIKTSKGSCNYMEPSASTGWLEGTELDAGSF